MRKDKVTQSPEGQEKSKITYSPITLKKKHEERKSEVKEKICKQLVSDWLNKPLHGQ